MRFYHCFYTELPDQFVEASASALTRWVGDWGSKPAFRKRDVTINTVPLNLSGKEDKDSWPTISANSRIILNRWMQSKGVEYNGRYWESLEEDQRYPYRTSGSARRNYTSGGAVGGAVAAIDLARIFAGAGSSGLVFSDLGIEHTKPPLKRDAFRVGEIIGYRCWKVENGLLRSVYQDDVWVPGKTLEGRELGDWDQRGIHAWKDPASRQYSDYIRSYLRRDDWLGPFILSWSGVPSMRSIDLRPAMVTGTVYLWGDVVEHERGWRAEYARVRSIDWLYPDETMMGREQQVLDELRIKYGCATSSLPANDRT